MLQGREGYDDHDLTLPRSSKIRATGHWLLRVLMKVASVETQGRTIGIVRGQTTSRHRCVPFDISTVIFMALDHWSLVPLQPCHMPHDNDDHERHTPPRRVKGRHGEARPQGLTIEAMARRHLDGRQPMDKDGRGPAEVRSAQPRDRVSAAADGSWSTPGRRSLTTRPPARTGAPIATVAEARMARPMG